VHLVGNSEMLTDVRRGGSMIHWSSNY